MLIHPKVVGILYFPTLWTKMWMQAATNPPRVGNGNKMDTSSNSSSLALLDENPPHTSVSIRQASILDLFSWIFVKVKF